MPTSQVGCLWSFVDLLSSEDSTLFKETTNASTWDADSDLCLRSTHPVADEKVSFRFILPATRYEFVEIDVISLGASGGLEIIAVANYSEHSLVAGETVQGTFLVTSGRIRTYRLPYIGEIEAFTFSGFKSSVPINIKQIRFFTRSDRLHLVTAPEPIPPDLTINAAQLTREGVVQVREPDGSYPIVIASGAIANLNAIFTMDGITRTYGLIRLKLSTDFFADAIYTIRDQTGLAQTFDANGNEVDIFVTTEFQSISISAFNTATVPTSDIIVSVELLFFKALPNTSAFGIADSCVVFPLAGIGPCVPCTGTGDLGTAEIPSAPGPGPGGGGGGEETPVTFDARVLWFPSNRVVEYSLAPDLTTRVLDAALLGDGTTVSYKSGCYTPDWSPIYNPADDMMYFTALKYIGATDIANNTNPHHMLIKFNPRTLVIVSEIELPGGKNKLTDNTTLQMVDVADNRIWLASAVPLTPTIPARVSTFTRPKYRSGDTAAVMVNDTDVLYGCIDWQAGAYTPLPYHYDTITLNGTVISNTTVTVQDYNGHYGTPYQCLNIPQVMGYVNQTGGPPLDFGEWYYNGVLGVHPLGDGIGLDGQDVSIFSGRMIAIGANIYNTGSTSDLGNYIGGWAINTKHPFVTKPFPSGWTAITLVASDDGYIYTHNPNSGYEGTLQKRDTGLNVVYDWGTSGPVIGGFSFAIWNNIICYSWTHGGGDRWYRADRMNADHTFTMLGECASNNLNGDMISLGNGYVSVWDGIIALFAPDVTQTVRVYNTADLSSVFSISEPAYAGEWTYGQAGASGKFVKRNGVNHAKIDVVTITSPTTYTKATISPDISGGNPVFDTRGGERRCWSSTSNKMFVRNVGSAGVNGIIATLISLSDNSLSYVYSPADKDFGNLKTPFWDPRTNTYQTQATDGGSWQGSIEISATGTIFAQHGGSTVTVDGSYAAGWETLGNYVFMYNPLNKVGIFLEGDGITRTIPAFTFSTDTFTTVSGLTWPMNNYAIAVGNNVSA